MLGSVEPTFGQIQSGENAVEEELPIQSLAVAFDLLRPSAIEGEGIQRPEDGFEAVEVEHDCGDRAASRGAMQEGGLESPWRSGDDTSMLWEMVMLHVIGVGGRWLAVLVVSAF